VKNRIPANPITNIAKERRFVIDELRVIHCVIGGQTDAFRVLVDRYQQRIIRFCLNMVSNQHDAEEVVQDVFLQAFQNLRRFQSDQASFSTWLYTIARNRCLNHLKKHHPLVSEVALEASCPGAVDADATQREFFASVDKALNDLPLDQKTAFVLAEMEQLPYADIAEIQQTTVGTVKSRVHRAKRALRSILAPIEGTP
jgi:RNA polymerase sigma-70 factor (ECF subfamily)